MQLACFDMLLCFNLLAFCCIIVASSSKMSLHPFSASKATQKGVGWCWLVEEKWFELLLCYDTFTMHHIGIMQWQISLCLPTHWLCIMLICNIFKNGACIIFWHQRQCKKAFGRIDCQERNGLNWDFVLSSKNGVHVIIWWHHHLFMPIGYIPVDTYKPTQNHVIDPSLSGHWALAKGKSCSRAWFHQPETYTSNLWTDRCLEMVFLSLQASSDFFYLCVDLYISSNVKIVAITTREGELKWPIYQQKIGYSDDKPN